MNSKKYLQGVLKTESNDFNSIKKRLDKTTIRLLHAAMGTATEAGEVVDILKKHVFYGKKIDKIHLLEELGDLLWYISIAIDALDSDFETVMKMNQKKLFSRYKDKFTSDEAINRKLDKEYSILKQNLGE
jgi:NTP pyrophosphatase (non-canonical NTP hydrolase)